MAFIHLSIRFSVYLPRLGSVTNRPELVRLARTRVNKKHYRLTRIAHHLFRIRRRY